MSQSESSRLVEALKNLTSLFLREVLAVGAGIEAGDRSLAELGDLASEMRHCDMRDNLRAFFDSLEPYRSFGDFQGLETLPRPRPLELHIEPHIFYGRFRAWLRKRGIDPDAFGESETETTSRKPRNGSGRRRRA